MGHKPFHCTARVGSREDYAALAALSDEFGVSYEVLAGRLEEEGESIESMRAELQAGLDRKRKWVLLGEAERIVPGIESATYSSGIALRRKLNSKTATQPRGCGWLWLREDLENLARIKRDAQLSLAAALRVFDARRKDKL